MFQLSLVAIPRSCRVNPRDPYFAFNKTIRRRANTQLMLAQRTTTTLEHDPFFYSVACTSTPARRSRVLYISSLSLSRACLQPSRDVLFLEIRSSSRSATWAELHCWPIQWEEFLGAEKRYAQARNDWLTEEIAEKWLHDRRSQSHWRIRERCCITSNKSQNSLLIF